jgi:hypothetical protein
MALDALPSLERMDREPNFLANLQIPEGLTLENLEAVEDDVLEWKDSGDYRALDIIAIVFERLTAVARARRSVSHLDSGV